LCTTGPWLGWLLCAQVSDLMHPFGALAVGAVAGALFVVMFTLTQNKWRIDDVLGVWPCMVFAALGAALLLAFLACNHWAVWVV
jgi:ammonia channel protein AmtB